MITIGVDVAKTSGICYKLNMFIVYKHIVYLVYDGLFIDFAISHSYGFVGGCRVDVWASLWRNFVLERKSLFLQQIG